ncbi:MAG TPA: sigma factor-like helix-turn-helix DNA-binding protein [Clostridia bacterium]|nr:sigma factor-like helix-turn-helix DNA-binding protein [Clostridia bacterium]
MEKEKKFFIRIRDHVEQVTEELYREYYKMQRREHYLEEQDLVHGKVLYSQIDNVYGNSLGEELLVDRYAEDICEVMVRNILIENLKECLKLLSNDELNLISQLFYKEKSQRQLSVESGIPLMTISDRKKRILNKLKKYMKI